MATILVVVADVRPHKPDQMALAKEHDVREELAPAVSDPAFCGSILPGAAKGRTHWLCTHQLDEPHDRRAEDRVAVKDEISRRGVVGKSFTQCWMTQAAVG